MEARRLKILVSHLLPVCEDCTQPVAGCDSSTGRISAASTSRRLEQKTDATCNFSATECIFPSARGIPSIKKANIKENLDSSISLQHIRIPENKLEVDLGRFSSCGSMNRKESDWKLRLKGNEEDKSMSLCRSASAFEPRKDALQCALATEDGHETHSISPGNEVAMVMGSGKMDRGVGMKSVLCGSHLNNSLRTGVLDATEPQRNLGGKCEPGEICSKSRDGEADETHIVNPLDFREGKIRSCNRSSVDKKDGTLTEQGCITGMHASGNHALTQNAASAEDCIFCHIVQGRAPAFKLYEDETCICILDAQPLTLGHSLIIPKAHFPSLELTPPQIAAAMCATVPLISNAIMEAASCESFNLLVNSGIAAGQVIFHTHFHIIPRRLGDHLWTSESERRRPLRTGHETSLLVQQIRNKLSGLPTSQE